MPCISKASTKCGSRGDLADTSHEKRKGLAVAPGDCCGSATESIPELPEDLVERIIARMPFPSLLKARCLSKSWNSKFAVPSSSEKSLSSPCQEQVAWVSAGWPVFSPVYVDNREMLGFDRGSSQWRKMLTLSYLPMDSWRSSAHAGPLMCIISKSESSFDVLITNVITKCWRKLPTCPVLKDPVRNSHEEPDSGADLVKILPWGHDGYRVVLADGMHRDEGAVRTQVYDSKLNTWRLKEVIGVNIDTFHRNKAYLDGKLYCICLCDPVLWMYDVVEESWTATCSTLPRISFSGAVLRCGDKVMVVTCVEDYEDGVNVKIYELIPATQSVKHVATGLPDAWLVSWQVCNEADDLHLASDFDFVYMGLGLNPFAKV